MRLVYWILFFGAMSCAFSPPKDKAYIGFLGNQLNAPEGLVFEFDRLHDLDSILVYDSSKGLVLRYLDTVSAQIRGPMYLYEGKFSLGREYEFRIYAKGWSYISKVTATRERGP
jgi:hypothetical protein